MLVYLLLNTVTEMAYVGLTTGRMRDRLKQHVRHTRGDPRVGQLYDDLRAWPFECWEAVVLERADSLDALLDAERRWILKLETHLPGVGYNVMVPDEDYARRFKEAHERRAQKAFKRERVDFYDMDGRTPWLVEEFTRVIGYEGAKDGAKGGAAGAKAKPAKRREEMTPEERQKARENGRRAVEIKGVEFYREAGRRRKIVKDPIKDSNYKHVSRKENR